MAVDKLFGNLTSEQREKAKQCKSPEEFLKLAGVEGIDLTDEAFCLPLWGRWQPTG